MDEPDPQTTLRATSAPFVIGIQISLILAGISIIQTFTYFSLFRHDSRILKFVVLATETLNLVCCGLDMHVLWRNSITVFGDYVAIAKEPISRLVALYLSGFIALLVQGWFAHRSFRAVNNSFLLLGVMVALIIASFAGVFAVASLQIHTPVFVDPAHSLRKSRQWATLLWLWASVSADVCITTILVYHLRTSRNGVDLPDKAQALVTKALRLALTTGSATTTLAFLGAIVFITAARENNAYVGFAVNIPRLHAISLLHSLNCRINIRSDLDRVEWPPNAAELQLDLHRQVSKPWNPQLEPHPDIPGRQIMVHQTTEVTVTHKVSGPEVGDFGFSIGRTTPLDHDRNIGSSMDMDSEITTEVPNSKNKHLSSNSDLHEAWPVKESGAT